MELLNLSSVVRKKNLKTMVRVNSNVAIASSVSQEQHGTLGASTTASSLTTPSSPVFASSSSSAAATTATTSSSAASTAAPPLTTSSAPSFSTFLARTPCSASTSSAVRDAPSTLSCTPRQIDDDGSGSDPTPTPSSDAELTNTTAIGAGGAHLAHILSGPFGAEDALARALHLISELNLSEEIRHPKVHIAQAAVAEAVPLVSGLRSEVDGLRAQLEEYGKLMAERDQALEKLRADVADLEEARSLYRQQVAELCSSTVTTPLPSMDWTQLPTDWSRPPSETSTSVTAEPSPVHRARSQRRMCLPPPPQQQQQQEEELLPSRQLALGCLPAWGSHSRIVPTATMMMTGCAAVSVSEAAARALNCQPPSVLPQVRPPSPTAIDTPVRRLASPDRRSAEPDGLFGYGLAAAADADATTAPATVKGAAAPEDELQCATPMAAAAPPHGGCFRGATAAAVSPLTFRGGVKRFGPASDEMPYSTPYTPTYQPGPAAAASAALLSPSPSSEGGSGFRHTISGWEGFGIGTAAALAAAAALEVRKLWPESGTKKTEWSHDSNRNDSPAWPSEPLSSSSNVSHLTTHASVGPSSSSSGGGGAPAASVEEGKAASLRTRRHSYVWRQRASRGAGAGDTSGNGHPAPFSREQQQQQLSNVSKAPSFVWLKAEELESVSAWEAATAMVL